MYRGYRWIMMDIYSRKEQKSLLDTSTAIGFKHTFDQEPLTKSRG